MNWLNDLFKPLGYFGLAVWAGAWLLRKVTEHWLSVTALRHEIRYRRVFDEQLRTMERTYELIVKLYPEARGLLNPFEMIPTEEQENSDPKAQMAESLRQALAEVNDYFYLRGIYFPEPLYLKIDELVTYVAGTSDKFYRAYLRNQNRTEPSEEFEMNWSQLSDEIVQKAPKLLADIRAAFQRLLGTDRTG